MRADFINSFRPHNILAWIKPILQERRDLLVKRGICVRSERTRSPYEEIIYLLYWANYLKQEDMKTKIAEKEMGREDQTPNKQLKKGHCYIGQILPERDKD